MRHASFVTRMLVAASALAVVLGVQLGLAHADPAQEDRPLPRSLRLEYVRGPGAQGCPDAETTEHVISARVHHVRFDPAASARLIVTVSRQGIKYKATAEVRDGEGTSIWTRPFTPLDSCNMLLMDIGFMVGERFSLPPPEPVPSAESPPPPPPSSPKPDALSSPLEQLEPGAARWRFGGSLALAIGAAPAILSPALTLADGGREWGLTPDWGFSGSLGLRWTLPMGAATSGGLVELSTTQVAGVLAPCAHWRMFFGCMTLELGALFATSMNVTHPETGILFWAATGPRLGLEWPVPRVPRSELRFFGDLPVTLHSVALVVGEGHMGEQRQQWKSPPVAGALSLGFVTFLD